MTEQHDLFGVSAITVIPAKPTDRVLLFGKYKSQPYEVLLADADYALWLLNSMHAKLESVNADSKLTHFLAFLPI